MAETVVTVGVGDIHGRFMRVKGWLEALESALGRPLDAVFAVGDVEAFPSDGHARRKRVKQELPAEYRAWVQAPWRSEGRPALYFIGGNNEDFEALHPLSSGGELEGGLRYLGRVGTVALSGLKVAFLSGIHAPRFYEAPLLPPLSVARQKQCGYFRKREVEQLAGALDVDLLLLHEWPKGLLARGRPRGPGLPQAYRTPWLGNVVARTLVEKLRPSWVLCGHSHVPFAASIQRPPSHPSRVACLADASEAFDAVFWVEWKGRSPVRAGWGVDGRAAWRAGEGWDEARLPTKADSARPSPGQ